MEISDDTPIQAAPEQLSARLDDNTVVLELSKGTYYRLNDVGGRVWEMLQRSTTIADIARQIVEEYAIDDDQCLEDIRGLGRRLAEEGLIVTVPV